jgi:replicative DNA helicase
MTDTGRPVSEAEELDSFLAALEGGGAIKDIAGWETGFAALSRALNGISPGLHLLIGPTLCGKSAFAKQLIDQMARQNSVPALFFAFGEKKNDLRLRTLARLSGDARYSPRSELPSPCLWRAEAPVGRPG